MEPCDYHGWRIWVGFQPDVAMPWRATGSKYGEVVTAHGFDAEDAIRRLKQKISKEPDGH